MELVFEPRHSEFGACTKIYLLWEGTTIFVYRDKEAKIMTAGEVKNNPELPTELEVAKAHIFTS